MLADGIKKKIDDLSLKLSKIADKVETSPEGAMGELIVFRMQFSAELDNVLKELKEEIEKAKPSVEQKRDRRKAESSANNANDKRALEKFNAVSLKNNNDDRISEFKFSSKWEHEELVAGEPQYWMMSVIDSESYYLFPNPTVISKSNYVEVYQRAYNINNFVSAGVPGRHVVLSLPCIVKDGKIFHKGEGEID